MFKMTRSRLQPKVPYVLSVLRLLLLPALGVIMLQGLASYQQMFDNSVFYSKDWLTAIGSRFWWNYLILLIPYVFLYALPYFKISSIVLSSLVFIFGLAEHFVILFRNTIIFPWDLANITIAAKVSGTYQYAITKEIIIGAIIFAVMVALAFVGKEIKFKIWMRAILIMCVVIFSYFYMTGFVINKTAQANKKIAFYYTIVNYNFENGVLLNFFYHTQFLFRAKPEGYSTAKVKEELSAYNKPTTSIVPGNQKPDVIMIMSEAFSDLRNAGDFKTSQAPMPFWDSLSGNNVIKKTLLVSEYGGNTANSEFEVLTGMSMQFFESGTYPFKQYIRKKTTSIASVMKDNEYQTLATHPFDKTGWNRNQVLPLLGFDSFVSDEVFTDATRHRNYVSDQFAFQFIINQYEESKAQNPDIPLFQYLMTIQNHGGYASPATLPYTVTPVTETKYPQATQYMSLLRLSDDALQMLIQYFEQIDHPTVIILYGDHLPALNDDFMTFLADNSNPNDPQRLLRRYETQLLVWANYDLSDSDLAKIEDSYISTNYVSTYLADITGQQRTPLQQFLLNLHNDIPAMSSKYVVSKDGTVYNATSKNLPAALQEELKKYRNFQYFNLYEAG